MMRGNLQDEYSALADWLNQVEWQVFGTLKFSDGSIISEQQAERSVKIFFNKLDRLYFGSNLVKSGQRIERVTFRHLGTSGENLHYHFIANPLGNVAKFCENAKQIWGSLDHSTLSQGETRVEPIGASTRAATYGLHEYWRNGADLIHLPTTHISRCRNEPASMPKMRRLLKQDALNQVNTL